MALATSLAAALARSGRGMHLAVAIAVTVAAVAPVFAADEVYIWRDQSGTVRFSAIEPAPPQPSQARDADWREVTLECRGAPVVVAQP